VAFGVNCSPFLLNATIKYHIDQQPSSEVVQELKENLYMDDWLSGTSEIHQAAEMYTEARRIMADAGMDLIKMEFQLENDFQQRE
jgi:hypothetical protein